MKAKIQDKAKKTMIIDEATKAKISDKAMKAIFLLLLDDRGSMGEVPSGQSRYLCAPD